MIYGLLRLAWEKKVLVIGLIKDIKQKEKIQHDPFLKSMMDPYSLEEE
jgi:hypothetical protein